MERCQPKQFDGKVIKEQVNKNNSDSDSVRFFMICKVDWLLKNGTIFHGL